jgi:L-rhamnose-H+ transport protein
MSPLVSGFGLILLASVSGGVFALPLRIRRRYEVENTMLVAMLFATIIIPFVTARFLLPDWTLAIAAVGYRTLLPVVAFGFGWGMGAVTFALGVNAIGLSIGYATIMGISTAVGSLIPMLRRWEEIPGDAKAFTLLGMGICGLGVILCGRAGFVREHSISTETSSSSKPQRRRIFLIGLFWCIVSGFLSACANLGFDFAQPVEAAAANLGANPIFATLSRWLAMYWGGYLALSIVFGSKMLKRKTWRNYSGASAARDFGLAVLMGGLHFLAQIPYGMGTFYLGRLGTTVGWVVNIAFSLVVANLLGFITGEWRTAVALAKKIIVLGLTVMMVAVLVLAYANSLLPATSS